MCIAFPSVCSVFRETYSFGTRVSPVSCRTNLYHDLMQTRRTRFASGAVPDAERVKALRQNIIREQRDRESIVHV